MHLTGEAKEEVLETVVVTMLKGGGEKNSPDRRGPVKLKGVGSSYERQ